MDSRISEVITKAVADAERYPFLFIGSGLSRRYTSSPTWAGLLESICDEVLDDRYAFARYRSEAHKAVQEGFATSELPYTATIMENDINRHLLADERFAGFRSCYDAELRGGQSPMKTYVADHLSGLNYCPSSETKLLVRAGREKVSGVITTNYDKLCEGFFPSYKVYVGESDLLFSEPSFAQEIYKIHGSVEAPNGMVLTEADYREFSSRRKYLAAKLLTIFVEYPVLFLGYSIQDENVKTILADICECVPEEQLGRLRDRLIFIEHRQETRLSEHTMDLGGHLLSMTRITTNDFESIYRGLLETKRLYNTRIIRELKGNVFKLAKRIDPTSEVVTSGFDAVLDRMAPDQRIAIQIAISSAAIGRPISAEDIYQDVVLDDLGMDHRFIVDNYLNAYVQRLAGGIPFYKYIADLGGEAGKAIEKRRTQFSTLDSFRTKSIRKGMESKHRRFEGYTSVQGLEKVCTPDNPFGFIPYLYDNEIDVDELGSLLKKALLATKDKSPERERLLKDSAYRKCVRMYDFLRYGKQRS